MILRVNKVPYLSKVFTIVKLPAGFEGIFPLFVVYYSDINQVEEWY
jgi:hypothetical protein